jgi:hypothetical protein
MRHKLLYVELKSTFGLSDFTNITCVILDVLQTHSIWQLEI